jgi:hypothetical protein
VNPKSLGNGYFYQGYRDGNGFEVATAKISDYQLNTAYTIHNVSKDQPAIFPWINLDNQGNLYATWVTGGVVKYRYSQISLPTNNPAVGGIPGTTWSDTYVVNPSALGGNVFPEVVAGDPGHVAIVYDGTTDYTGQSDFAPATARWQPYVSIATDPLGNAPTFQTGAVSHRVVHVGSICTSGTACMGDRSLLDLIDIQMDTSGRVGLSTPTTMTSSGGNGFIDQPGPAIRPLCQNHPGTVAAGERRREHQYSHQQQSGEPRRCGYLAECGIHPEHRSEIAGRAQRRRQREERPAGRDHQPAGWKLRDHEERHSQL